MSMDAGGLAQMSYNNFPSSNGLGMPGSGFAARRANGGNLKRLSFQQPKQADPQDNGAPTPRTSRSHLLAGLRTAPKSAVSGAFPSTAPPTQLHHNTGLGASIYADKEKYAGPKTGFPHQQQQTGYGQMKAQRQMYPVAEQILAPPEIQIDEQCQENMDPNLYAQLVATNMYLAEQQQRLQQQLMSVQQAAQHFQGMSLGMGQQQFATPPITPHNMYQQQQVKSNMQPIVTPVMGAQPGLYSCYHPATGQQTYFMDQSGQAAQYIQEQALQASQPAQYSPPQQPGTPRFQVSPPPPSSTPTFTRSISPPKKSQSPPQDHAPLPPPSAGAFRRGHRKATSMAVTIDNTAPVDGPRSAMLPKSHGFPPTPTTSGFGPGQARAGEHPIRQPRGPPPLDELKAKPTAKFEGSKNFATRTRRNAVHNLVRAGMERRRGPGSSSGSMSPVSETGEVAFSVSSDNDSDSGRSGSGSLSGRPSLGSSRTSAHGAIGSDRPSSRQKDHSLERKSVASFDSNFTAASVSSDEGQSVGGSFAAVFKNGGKKPEPTEGQRKAPMLVLTSVEKRKSSVF
ncbi:hypothetical protein BJ875DRAFT_269922 [Amylocarpus encephaloides]|uniref:Uncharacterized protein n=1 Tax=Amylocarpus encephaloides TaxID=45428 RepID=A0A9P7YKH4_9HELO|nr:hypothetical protein BJ875DRAFT_269922 [Amylocarpus encephaloides]